MTEEQLQFVRRVLEENRMRQPQRAGELGNKSEQERAARPPQLIEQPLLFADARRPKLYHRR